MPLTDYRYRVPAAAQSPPVVGPKDFDGMVQRKADDWWRLDSAVAAMYPVEGVNLKWFRLAKLAVDQWRNGDKSRSVAEGMARGYVDWFLCCQHRDGKLVYVRRWWAQVVVPTESGLDEVAHLPVDSPTVDSARALIAEQLDGTGCHIAGVTPSPSDEF